MGRPILTRRRARRSERRSGGPLYSRNWSSTRCRAIEAAEADAEAAAAEAAAEVDFEAEEAAEEAEDARALASLETQVWLELDLSLRTLAKLRAPGNKAGVPSQLLDCRRRRQREAGPTRFDLENLASQLRERYDGAKAEGEVDASKATRIMSQSITSASRQGDVLSG